MAILAGLVSGYYLIRLYSRQLLIVMYHLPFRFLRPYLALYDRLESQYTYELLGGEDRFKGRAVFQKRYDTLRSHAEQDFVGLWDRYTLRIARDYGVVIVISLVIFWRVWWVFASVLIVVQVIALAQLRYVERYDSDLIVTAVLSLLLENEQSH